MEFGAFGADFLQFFWNSGVFLWILSFFFRIRIDFWIFFWNSQNLKKTLLETRNQKETAVKLLEKKKEVKEQRGKKRKRGEISLSIASKPPFRAKSGEIKGVYWVVWEAPNFGAPPEV